MKVSRENPWYWELGGRPVLLLGGSDEDNIFNHPDVLDRNIAALVNCGGNYLRCTLSSRDRGNVRPYVEFGGTYDLYRFNNEYFERLEYCLKECAGRGIVVQIELWATFDFYREHWLENPFNPAKNLNYTSEKTTLIEEWPYHPAEKPQPFFRTVPALNDDQAVLKFQRAFVDKVLEVTLPFQNALYCLDNETAAPPEWAWYWGEYLNKEAARRGFTVNLTEMWDDHDIRDGRNAHTWDRPDIFKYVEVSQNNWLSGRAHWEHLMWMRRKLASSEEGPRPMNNVKVYASGPSGGVDIQTAAERFWQNILAGCASTRFHRPTSAGHGIGLNENARNVIKAARAFTKAFDILHAEPAGELLSDVPASGAYCAAKKYSQYAVYFPEGGKAVLDVSHGPRAMVLRWFDPRTRAFRESHSIRGATRLPLVAPDSDKEWLALITPSV